MMNREHIRWRLNDPAAEYRQRWTKVHVVSFHAADMTRCHILIPDFAYMVDHDDQIPADAQHCKRCERACREETDRSQPIASQPTDRPEPIARCEGRYPVPRTSPPRDEPFDVTYRCALPQGHEGPHGAEPQDNA